MTDHRFQEKYHPASSKLDLFEAMLENIVDQLKKNPDLFRDTALFVTFDEGGGYYDTGFMQPLDFFGDAPRIPMIVVSQYARGGRIVHSYNDHASAVKFIERNWGLEPLTARSRDNLPNPHMSHSHPTCRRTCRRLAICSTCLTSTDRRAEDTSELRSRGNSPGIFSHDGRKRLTALLVRLPNDAKTN